MRDSSARRQAGRRGALLGTALVLLLSLAPGMAEAVLTPQLQAEGWRELPNPHKDENHFSLGPDGAIEVVSKDSISTLYKPVDVHLSQRPILTWRWRVDQAAPATDLAAKNQDDCSLAVYVGFPYRPGQASLFDRLKRPLVEAWAGENAPGRVLRYAFCGRRPRGEMVKSPYLGDAGMIKILRPADSPTGKWFEERVDVAADYRQAFGEPPQDPTQIAVEADTDDTHSASRAEVADLSFVARSAVAAANPPRFSSKVTR
jgi:Protein of unknown function (DUF3047)